MVILLFSIFVPTTELSDNKLIFPRIGATGHIGGAILSAVVDRFPAIHVVGLVRNRPKAEKLQQVFHGIQTRVGNLRDVQLIEFESRAAQVVISPF